MYGPSFKNLLYFLGKQIKIEVKSLPSVDDIKAKFLRPFLLLMQAN